MELLRSYVEPITFLEYIDKYLPNEFEITYKDGLTFEGKPIAHALIANVEPSKGFEIYGCIPQYLDDLTKIHILSNLITIYKPIAQQYIQSVN